MNARTTVLIPFLEGNNEDYLKQTIQSIPYGVPYIVARNTGEMAEAMNEALTAIDTEFLMTFGADDVLLDGCVEMLESLAWDADVCYPSMILTTEDLQGYLGTFQAQPFCPQRLHRWNFVSGGSLLRTEKVREVGGWRQLRGLEDWELYVRMCDAGARFKPVPECAFVYRQVEGSRNKGLSGSKEDWRADLGIEPEPVQATFYYQATPQTTYWRCQLPARYLPAVCIPEVEVHADEEHLHLPDQEGDVAVFQFPGDQFRAAVTALVMPAAGVRTIVETDDNYLTSARHRKRQGWVRTPDQGPHSLQGHAWIVGRCNAVIVTTESLARQYRKVNPNVYVCPNQIEPSDWAQTEKLDDGVLRIGWFASRSHSRDAPLVARALEWAAGQKDVEIVTMGLDPSWKFPRRHVPWSNDLGTYWRMMTELLDVGVAPIVETPWSVCRSDLKALEYAHAGALPILSESPPYGDWKDGEGCWKATDAKGFLDRIRWCVQHRDEVKQMAARAREYVLAERTVEKNIWRWQEAIAGDGEQAKAAA